MLTSPILEVALGMMFFYLLLSWICSAVNEVVEAWLRNRANDLETGIRRLLLDPDPQGGGFWLNLGRRLNRLVPWRTAPPFLAKTDGLASRLYNHALISCLYLHAKDLPAYIPARYFALALTDLLSHGVAAAPPALGIAPLRAAIADPANPAPPGVRTALLALMDASGDDTARFRENIEGWFNSSMDSVSSWYKRRTQLLIFVLGVAIAVAVNGDSILTMQMLWNSSELRSSLSAQAAQVAAQQTPPVTASSAARIAGASAQLQKSGLPIGWNAQDDLHRPPWTLDTWGARFSWSWHLVALHWLGWLITGFAISLGAPFWFDLLNKFVVARSAVKPLEKSRDDPANP